MKKIMQMVVAGIALGVALSGCGGGGGGTTTLDDITNPGANYIGSFSGTFTPTPSYITDSSKEWRINIKSNGGISGHTDNYSTGGAISGTIDANGAFTALQDGGANGDITLTGTVDKTNGTVSGTWVWNKITPSATPSTGTFSGTKEVIPASRFTDTGKGTIYDAASNLTWLKNANCFGQLNATSAATNAGTLANGVCGLSDGSGAGAWRLPTPAEMLFLYDDGYTSSTLSAAGFASVQPDYYWSSAANLFNIDDVWGVNMSTGAKASINIGNLYYFWAVHTGQ